jgi:transcriptional regulator with XRE-family HTH domain
MLNIASSQWTRTHGTLLLAVSLEPKEIGQRIAAARVRKGWTQLSFALEAAVSPSTITRWESGKLPPVRELMRIAELLGVSPEELVEPDDPGRDDRIAHLESELAETQQALKVLPDVQAALVRIESLLRGDEGAAQQS